MSDGKLYVDSHEAEAEEFWGEGEMPPVMTTVPCVCRGEMKAVVSPVRMGAPPISTWHWVCRVCKRERFGGRWVEE